MLTVSIFIIAFALGFYFSHKFYYSPEIHIKKLWDEIHKYAYEIGQLKKGREDIDLFLLEPFEEECKKRGKLINSLLELYFDPNEDLEFIKEYRYTNFK